MVATTVVPRGESVTVGVGLPTVEGDETCLDNLELELRTFPEEPDFVPPPTPPPPPPPLPPPPPPPPSGTLISFEFFRLNTEPSSSCEQDSFLSSFPGSTISSPSSSPSSRSSPPPAMSSPPCSPSRSSVVVSFSFSFWALQIKRSGLLKHAYVHHVQIHLMVHVHINWCTRKVLH